MSSFTQDNVDVELDDFAPSSSRPGSTSRGEASLPLLSRPDGPAASIHQTRHVEDNLTGGAFHRFFLMLPRSVQNRLPLTMAPLRGSKAAHLLGKLQTHSEPGLTNAQMFLTNNDLKPVEEKRRTWWWWSFVAFWIADSFNINTWMIASSMITQNGLAWWQALLCVWIGYSIAAVFICLTGRIGAVYHISFPVVS